MARILVLGGGFGGIATALGVRDRLGDTAEVVLVDRRDTFAMGLRKNWALAGIEAHSVGERKLELLASRGVSVVRGEIDAIDPQTCSATVDGEPLLSDVLVVALGAERATESIPGLADNSLDVYDRDASVTNAGAIEAFSGGRVVVGVFGAPYPCPPAPYELALMVSERLDERGLSYGMLVTTVLPKSMPLLGDAGCAAFDSRLAAAGVSLRTDTKAIEVRPGEIIYDGGRIPFDLLLAVPPHRVPAAVREAGLVGPKGWIPVDARTLETRFPGVYAVGDVTAIPLSNGSAMPKAGVFAQAEGEVVAARIADALAGREPTAAFTGDGMCFLETGRGTAAAVQGSFLADPPEVELTESSAEGYAAKRAFEAERLVAWFGN